MQTASIIFAVLLGVIVVSVTTSLFAWLIYQSGRDAGERDTHERWEAAAGLAIEEIEQIAADVRARGTIRAGISEVYDPQPMI